MANRNKDAAVSFLKMASKGEVREAYSKFVGRGFKHHNPYFEGSAETLKEITTTGGWLILRTRVIYRQKEKLWKKP